MGKYFGTDGFRGEVNVTLTADDAYKVGRFLGAYVKKEKSHARILLGKDTRRSSDMLESALMAGVLASGTDIFRLGVITTPAVAFLVKHIHAALGVMISASHNPFWDNGIKLIDACGEKEEVILPALEAYLDGEGEIPFATGGDIGTMSDAFFMQKLYLDSLCFLEKGSCHRFSVGLDCANGSAFRLARAAFEYLGASVHAIHIEPDGTNINRDCGSTHPEALCRLVKEKHLDVGFALDGDGDRCLAVDENGEFVNGDQLLYVFARYMKKKGLLHGNTAVCTVMSGLGLSASLRREGIAVTETAVGDKYVWERMKKEGFSLGGEQSGHIILAHHATTGDGILTAIFLMEILLAERKTLSSLLSGFVAFPQVLQNVRVCNKTAALADQEVQAVYQREKMRLLPNGRLLLRASGTEPVLRIMAEAQELSLCEDCVRHVAEVVCHRFGVEG